MACSLVHDAVRWLEHMDIRKKLVLLVLRAAGRKTAHSNTAVSGNLLGRESFVHCPCLEYGKMLTDLKDGDKDSGVDVHWGWGESGRVVHIGELWEHVAEQICSEEFGGGTTVSYSEGLLSFFLWYQINNSITP